ncbi:hypothetical protein TNIN_475151 [Trichonephila inaurata madagascariensis]|uniref:Uncharacterized protein n=1 Tax=Trichonephila inaurata madagascariensis TaxID=2747483 RepID=A0A8X7BSY2_9ARAC|nr:hypothetical protein TNIN_475151 [Trichonephila inaurata madagascariensis]
MLRHLVRRNLLVQWQEVNVITDFVRRDVQRRRTRLETDESYISSDHPKLGNLLGHPVDAIPDVKLIRTVTTRLILADRPRAMNCQRPMTLHMNKIPGDLRHPKDINESVD